MKQFAWVTRKVKMGFLIVGTYRNFITIFGDYAGLYRKPSMVITTWSGAKYFIRSHRVTKTDFYVVNESWLYKLHTKIAHRFIHDGSTVIDIGAHIGAFTIFAAYCAKNVKVYSFEPNPGNFFSLKKNIELNHFEDTISALNMAVAGKSGNLTLYESTTDTGQHTAFEQRLEYEKTFHRSITVQCTTLKDILDSNQIETCDLIKIDCEGMEYDIIYNTPIEHLKRVKAFSIEHHWAPGGDYKELAAYLEKHGFTVQLPQGEFALIYAWQK